MATHHDRRAPAEKALDTRGTILRITVGKIPKETFYAHENILENRGVDLGSSRVNSTMNKVVLQEDKPCVVKCYLDYVYSGRLHTVSTPEEGKPFKTAVTSEYSLLCKAFVFGARIDDQNFVDAVASALLSRFVAEEAGNSGWVPNTKIINRAYDATEPGSVLRRLLTDIYMWGHSDGLPSSDDLCSGFLGDLSRAAFAAYKAKSAVEETTLIPAKVRSCDYHGHEEDSACPDGGRVRVKMEGYASAVPEKTDRTVKVKIERCSPAPAERANRVVQNKAKKAAPAIAEKVKPVVQTKAEAIIPAISEEVDPTVQGNAEEYSVATACTVQADEQTQEHVEADTQERDEQDDQDEQDEPDVLDDQAEQDGKEELAAQDELVEHYEQDEHDDQAQLDERVEQHDLEEQAESDELDEDAQDEHVRKRQKVE